MFAEKFSEMREGIGMPILDTVDLSLYYLPTHTVTQIPGHIVSVENSERVMDNRVLRSETCYL
jgi:hypothetical protein